MHSIVARHRGRSAEQWRQHLLQSGDQVIGLAGTLALLFDLLVFDGHLVTQKFVLPFQAFDVRMLKDVCRDRSRLVATCRDLSGLFNMSRVIAFYVVATCRGMPRHVASCRDLSHLLDVGDVLHHRRRRYEVLLAVRGLDAASIKVFLYAVALDRTGRAGEAGTLVEESGVFDRDGIFAVGARRGMSRLVVGHYR